MGLKDRVEGALPRFLGILKKMAFGLGAFGALLVGAALALGPPELSDPDRWFQRGAGMIGLGLLVWLASVYLGRGSLWSAPVLILLGVVISVTALIVPFPELEARAPALDLPVRFALIASWWALTVLAFVVCRMQRSPPAS